MGWSAPEEGYRWSQCPWARIAFGLGEVDADKAYLLQVSSGSYQRQVVEVWLNGERLGQMDFPGPGAPPETLTLAFSGELLLADRYNEIAFHIPGATSLGRADPRLLGLAFVGMRLTESPGE